METIVRDWLKECLTYATVMDWITVFSLSFIV